MNTKKQKILVSSCLLGEACRYDGKSKPCNEVIALAEKYTLIPVCAEVLGGLPTPRLPAEIVGERVLRCDGIDVTENYKRGAEAVLEVACQNDIKIAILKSNSPSCSNKMIYDGTFSRTLTEGMGILAHLLKKNGILVLNEKEIQNL